ncbi:MAG: hypothetical protein ACD_19C00068G0001, partial [uncultured bacterium]
MRKNNEYRTKIIVTKGVTEYRQTIEKYIGVEDVVLEIGFAWGTTTRILQEKCKKVIGVDKSVSYFTAIEQYPELELYQIDAFDISKIISLGVQFNKIYI